MIDKKKIVMENYFKTDCDLNTSIKQAYERGFNRAYEKCMSLIKKKGDNFEKYTECCKPVSVGDLLYLFSDLYGSLNVSVILCDYSDNELCFDATNDLDDVSDYENCTVMGLNLEDDMTLRISVKEL